MYNLFKIYMCFHESRYLIFFSHICRSAVAYLYSCRYGVAEICIYIYTYIFNMHVCMLLFRHSTVYVYI